MSNSDDCADETPHDPHFEGMVGYKRPPVEYRFQPGQSGNPGGRPEGSRSRRTYLERAAYRKYQVKDGRRTRQVAGVEIVLLKIKFAAINGNAAALRCYDQLNGILTNLDEPSIPRGILIAREEKMTPEEWDEVARRYLEEADATRDDRS